MSSTIGAITRPIPEKFSASPPCRPAEFFRAAWWGVTFTNHLANEITGTPLHVPLEPTQLFESAVEVANLIILMWLLKRRKFDGQVFGAFLFIYGVARFFLEFLRGDPGRGSVFGGAMSGTQLIAIGLVLGGGLIWWLRPGA